MSFEAITMWDAAKLRKLQALLVTLQVRQEYPSFDEKMASRIDDESPERWVTPEEFGRRLESVEP
jgi:hypothetical protein